MDPLPEGWRGRDDGPDADAQRWHQRVQPWRVDSASSPGDIVIIGYATDRGVTLNGGRAGASEGPRALRRATSNLPVHFKVGLWDAGDCGRDDPSVEPSQRELSTRVAQVRASGGRPLVFGGGHDVAFGNWMGLFESLSCEASKEGLISINLDAHLDNRPLPATGPNSGTSYTQMQNVCHTAAVPFRAAVFGLARECNTAALIKRAALAGETIVWRDEMMNPTLCAESIRRVVSGTGPIHLTIDLDVLSASTAPGVSAPTGIGVSAADVLRVLSILPWNRVIGVDIAELAPSLETDGRTARTAGSIAFAVVDHWIHGASSPCA
ncbi:MAG: formimidoylglutamase [Planctomycetota bacterium]|nr:formimidoylglutamase [Planctomycetota bacterium]